MYFIFHALIFSTSVIPVRKRVGVKEELRDLESCLKRQKWRKILETSKKCLAGLLESEAGGLVEE